MTKQLQHILHEMQESGDAQRVAVADCLIDMSQDDDDDDDFLLVCAEEIRDAAQSVIDRMRRAADERALDQITIL